MTAVLRAAGLTRVFGSGSAAVTACDHVDFELGIGELAVVRGRSGAGKTTLLNLLGGLDRPTSGTVLLGDVDLAQAPESELVRTRRTSFGYIFQDFGLLPTLSAAENIELPLRLMRMNPDERDGRVAQLLDLVGLERNGAQRPDELSGGQQQRVGIARALARRPRILLADEPTGQLDSTTGAAMIALLVDVVHEEGVSAIVTTHDQEVMTRADRVLTMRDGRLASDAE